jgi:hypothetical protein
LTLIEHIRSTPFFTESGIVALMLLTEPNVLKITTFKLKSDRICQSLRNSEVSSQWNLAIVLELPLFIFYA